MLSAYTSDVQATKACHEQIFFAPLIATFPRTSFFHMHCTCDENSDQAIISKGFANAFPSANEYWKRYREG